MPQHPLNWIIPAGVAFLFLLSLLSRWIQDSKNFPRLENKPLGSPPGKPPLLSIVIPARNEETNIEGCLKSVLASDYANMEVIAVNDRSSDSTGEIVSRIGENDGRVVRLDGSERPQGWAGKNWAIHQGSLKARGNYLLIIDADVIIAPFCIPQAMKLAVEEDIDLLTLFPKVECRSFWEKVIMPALGIIPSFRMERINNPESTDANAFGYFLLFKKQAFDRIGGYEGIKGRVGEDWVVANRIKKEGLKLKMLLGHEVLKKRFGPTFKEIWEGFTKNFVLILDERKWMAILALPLVILLCGLILMPWAGFVASIVFFITHEKILPALCLHLISLGSIFTFRAIRRVMDVFFGLEESSVWLQPMGSLIVLGMWLVAIFRTVAGLGLVWRGRVYRKI